MKRSRNKTAVAFVSIVIGYLFGSMRKMKKINDQANKWKRQSDKYEQALLMTNRWLKLKHMNKSLEEFFLINRYYKVAIYGMNYIGIRLYEELKDSSVKVLYGIDKFSSSAEADILVYAPTDVLEKVDAVIVTPVYFFEEIKRDLKGQINAPIVSMNDVLSI